MIRSSAMFKFGAVALALGIHGLAAVSFNSQPDVLIESDAGAQIAALGSSFADMVEGTLAPKVTEQEVLPDPTIDKAITVTSPTETIQPREPAEALKQPPTPIKAQTVQPIAAPQALAATQEVKPASTEQVAALTPTRATPNVSANQPSQAKPIEAIKPKVQASEVETLEASENKNASAVSRSMRPKKRSAELEKRAAAAKPKPVKRAKSGNAKRNAKAGSSSGSQKAKSKKQGQGNSKTKRAGNAAASNYPGRVMARISSIGRPSVNARGTATVRFSIGSNGALRSAGIISSSGSRRLDNAAVNIIHNASPFPKPPAGARRTFSINIAGR